MFSLSMLCSAFNTKIARKIPCKTFMCVNLCITYFCSLLFCRRKLPYRRKVCRISIFIWYVLSTHFLLFTIIWFIRYLCFVVCLHGGKFHFAMALNIWMHRRVHLLAWDWKWWRLTSEDTKMRQFIISTPSMLFVRKRT